MPAGGRPLTRNAAVRPPSGRDHIATQAEADVGQHRSRLIVLADVENPATAANHPLVRCPIRESDARAEVVLVEIVCIIAQPVPS